MCDHFEFDICSSDTVSLISFLVFTFERWSKRLRLRAAHDYRDVVKVKDGHTK